MWRYIDGYEGYYEVSDDGRVRSVDRMVENHSGFMKMLRGSELKQTVSNAGYYVVNLRKHGESKVCFVHRIVAEAFIENTEGKETVNHIDGNKLNNNVNNLEWATYSENNVHALKNDLRKPRGNKVIQYSTDGDFIAEYRSACDASRQTGIGREVISACLNHYIHSAGGYIWVKESEGVTTIR